MYLSIPFSKKIWIFFGCLNLSPWDTLTRCRHCYIHLSIVYPAVIPSGIPWPYHTDKKRTFVLFCNQTEPYLYTVVYSFSFIYNNVGKCTGRTAIYYCLYHSWLWFCPVYSIDFSSRSFDCFSLSDIHSMVYCSHLNVFHHCILLYIVCPSRRFSLYTPVYSTAML